MSRPLAGYPQSNGAKIESVMEVAGPSSYTVVTPGAPPTGGQTIYAKDFGLKFFDHVEVGLSSDGTYLGVVSLLGNAGKATSAILMWIVAAGGAEAAAMADLDAITLPIRAIGY